MRLSFVSNMYVIGRLDSLGLNYEWNNFAWMVIQLLIQRDCPYHHNDACTYACMYVSQWIRRLQFHENDIMQWFDANEILYMQFAVSPKIACTAIAVPFAIWFSTAKLARLWCDTTANDCKRLHGHYITFAQSLRQQYLSQRKQSKGTTKKSNSTANGSDYDHAVGTRLPNVDM